MGESPPCRPARGRCGGGCQPGGGGAERSRNVYLALENDLEIIPVLNKNRHCPGADPARITRKIEAIISASTTSTPSPVPPRPPWGGQAIPAGRWLIGAAAPDRLSEPLSALTSLLITTPTAA